MTRIIVVRGTGASGVSLRPGEVAEVSAEDARILISLGKARAYVEPELPLIEPDLIPDDGIAGLTTESAPALVEQPKLKKGPRGEKPAA